MIGATLSLHVRWRSFNRPGAIAARNRRQARSAFTLLELLISISIVAILLSITSPALSRVLEAARSVKCQAGLRTLAFDFQLFADPGQRVNRGTDRSLGRFFRLATFEDSQYGIDEFWQYGSKTMVSMPDAKGDDPMRCPSVSGDVTLRRGLECSDGAISPAQKISYGFNRRLHRAEIIDDRGRPRAVPVLLDGDILTHGDVPLAWDIDGEEAFAKSAYPVFSAPTLGSRAVYGADRFWYPGARHNGAINVAFIGGHVLSSKEPLKEHTWRWGYQTRR